MIGWTDCIVQSVYSPHTLCEVCANACGFCRWSEYGVQKPVPGLDAVRRDIRGKVNREPMCIESYVVLDCPEFCLEERWPQEYQAFDRAWDRREALRKMW